MFTIILFTYWRVKLWKKIFLLHMHIKSLFEKLEMVGKCFIIYKQSTCTCNYNIYNLIKYLMKLTHSFKSDNIPIFFDQSKFPVQFQVYCMICTHLLTEKKNTIVIHCRLITHSDWLWPKNILDSLFSLVI